MNPSGLSADRDSKRETEIWRDSVTEKDEYEIDFYSNSGSVKCESRFLELKQFLSFLPSLLDFKLNKLNLLLYL